MKTIAVVIALLSLTGCIEGRPEETPAKPTKTAWIYLGNTVSIRQFRFPDGTRCVVTKGSYSGAVSCDWEKAQ